MPTRIVKVTHFDVEVLRAAKNEVKKAAKAAFEEAKVSTAGKDLGITVGSDRVVLGATSVGWSSPRFEAGDGDSAPTLAVIEAMVRTVGGTFAAKIDRDGEEGEARFEAPKGGGEAPALWAAKRVLAEVVKVSSVDASAALAAITERPSVKRADVNQALGVEAERVWTALDKVGLIRDGEIPTRGLYIWAKKQA
jgi:hypothetical protein